MITLYGKTNCRYTAKAIAALDELGLSFTKKNIADEEVATELIATGGKRQVPFLLDGDVSMYESDAIVEYLHEKYGHAEARPIRIHRVGENASMCHPETVMG